MLKTSDTDSFVMDKAVFLSAWLMFFIICLEQSAIFGQGFISLCHLYFFVASLWMECCNGTWKKGGRWRMLSHWPFMVLLSYHSDPDSHNNFNRTNQEGRNGNTTSKTESEFDLIQEIYFWNWFLQWGGRQSNTENIVLASKDDNIIHTTNTRMNLWKFKTT